MEKKRYANIDLLKSIAIIMVIAIHSHLFNTDFISTPTWSAYLQYALRVLCEGVAIFVLVNGFLLINKKEFNLKKHLKKTIKIFLILILWSLILTISIKLISKEPLHILDIIKNIFITDINNRYTGILWFLQNLITLYLMYPILKILHDKDKEIYDYLFIFLLVSTVFINLLGMVSNFINTRFNCNFINIFTAYVGKFQILTNRNFLIFFMLGGYIYENKEKFEQKEIRIKWIIIGISAWIFSYIFAILLSKLQNKKCIDSFNYESIFMPIILIGIFAITVGYCDNNKWYNKFIETVSKNTLGIYLIHIIIIRTIEQNNWLGTSIIYRVLKVILVFLSSLLLTLIIKKIPKVNKIIELS